MSIKTGGWVWRDEVWGKMSQFQEVKGSSESLQHKRRHRFVEPKDHCGDEELRVLLQTEKHCVIIDKLVNYSQYFNQTNENSFCLNKCIKAFSHIYNCSLVQSRKIFLSASSVCNHILFSKSPNLWQNQLTVYKNLTPLVKNDLLQSIQSPFFRSMDAAVLESDNVSKQWLV